MTTTTLSLVRRTFRITVDVETILTAKSRETLGDVPEHERYHQALVQHLLAHPPALRHLLRASAVEALLPAKKLLEAEYGWGKTSDQQYSSRSSRNSSRQHKRTSPKRWKTGLPSITSTAARQPSRSFPLQNSTMRRDDLSLCRSPPTLTGVAGHPGPVPVREDSNQ